MFQQKDKQFYNPFLISHPFPSGTWTSLPERRYFSVLLSAWTAIFLYLSMAGTVTLVRVPSSCHPSYQKLYLPQIPAWIMKSIPTPNFWVSVHISMITLVT
jgi:hypothetical protein